MGSVGADDVLARHRPLIEGYIRSRARTREDGEDLVQNVFLKAVRYLPEFRYDCPISQWLLRIAANELKNYYRRLSGEPQTCESDWERESSEYLQQSSCETCPSHDADSILTVQILMDVARRVCSDEESNVIAMIYQGETFEEIAELLATKSATVRSHFLRGRTKLLAHFIANEPEFVGGIDAIRSAIESVQVTPDRLAPEEVQALGAHKERSASFRSGCLKIARYLHMPVLLIMGVPWLM